MATTTRKPAGMKAELKPLVYLMAIGIPFVVIMWTLRKERGVER